MYWLDVVRYADSGGYHSDNERSVWLFAITSSRLSTTTTHSIDLPWSSWPATCCPPPREQKIARATIACCKRPRRAAPRPRSNGQVRRRPRAEHGRRLARLDDGLLPVPRPQVRSVHDEGLYSFGAFFADVREEPISRQEQTPMPSPEQEARLKQLDAEIALLASRNRRPKSWKNSSGRRPNFRPRSPQRYHRGRAAPRDADSSSRQLAG